MAAFRVAIPHEYWSIHSQRADISFTQARGNQPIFAGVMKLFMLNSTRICFDPFRQHFWASLVPVFHTETRTSSIFRKKLDEKFLPTLGVCLSCGAIGFASVAVGASGATAHIMANSPVLVPVRDQDYGMGEKV